MKYIISPNVTLFHADCIETMKSLPENSIDLIVCDPPYHLNSIVKRFGSPDAAPALSSAQRRFATSGGGDRPPGSDQFGRLSKGFMGKVWDGGDIAFQIETWREAWRVLKPGGYLAAFGAPKNFGRLQCAILDAGFEERDSILNVVNPDDAVAQFLESLDESQMDAFVKCLSQSDIAGMLAWTFGVGFPKGRDIGKDTGLSEWRGFNVALKPAFEPIVLARKPLSEKTVAANVLRWGTGALNIDGCRVGTTRGVPASHSKTAGKIGAIGIGTHRLESELDPNIGRWPANVVTDGSDEVVGMFPNTNPAKAGKPRQGKSGDGYGMTHTGAEYNDNGGSAARFFYSAKASKADRAGSKHPTVKPIKLLQWLSRLITPPGGTVLDPFAGSGTTGAACNAEGFNCIIIEREDEYFEDIKRRMAAIGTGQPEPANDNDPEEATIDLFRSTAA